MIPSERLKALHELAARTAREERALKLPIEELQSSIERLHDLAMQRRLRDLREWLMTDEEFAELRELNRQAERDRQDEANNDWTR